MPGFYMRQCSCLSIQYGSETMIRMEKERSRIRAVQMDNLRSLLGIRMLDNERGERKY